MNIKTNKDGSEIISYDEPGIPLYIRKGMLSAYPGYRAFCHWHEDMEVIYIIDGAMEYYVNGNYLNLVPGDTLIVNSGRLHYGYSSTGSECNFYCYLFHSTLIAANKKLMQKYIAPVTQTTQTDYWLFHKDELINQIILAIYDKKEFHSDSYELEVLELFHQLWKYLFQHTSAKQVNENSSDAELIAQRNMVSFIYQNMSGPLSLDTIAASGNVCRSKCCQIFRHHLGQPPMDFVNAYRLECSKQLLESTSLSITEICTSCGFNHLSYFSKQFQLKYGCSPREYRKAR